MAPPLLVRMAVVSLLLAFRLILTSLSRGWLIGAARSRHGLLILTPKHRQQQQQQQQPGASRGAWHSTSLLFSVSWLSVLLSRSLSCSLLLPPSLPPSSFFLSYSLLTAAVMMLCLHAQAAQGLRQPSVQFKVASPAPSMHTICFLIHPHAHKTPSLYPALPHSRDITECEVYFPVPIIQHKTVHLLGVCKE